MSMNILVGDAINNPTEGIICHVCNNIGKWGAGFVLAISRKWKTPEQVFRTMSPDSLGNTHFVKVGDKLWVCNMIAQNGIRTRDNLVPIRYDHLRDCLGQVAKFAKKHNLPVHMPLIGCGLAGGKWEIVEEIIKEEMDGVDCTVWSLNG